MALFFRNSTEDFFRLEHQIKKKTRLPQKEILKAIGQKKPEKPTNILEEEHKMGLKQSLQVMVVDDMSVSRALITNALDEIGIANYRVENDGQSALAKPKSSSETMQIDDIGIKAELNQIFNYEVVGALLVKFVLHVFRVFTLYIKL